MTHGEETGAAGLEMKWDADHSLIILLTASRRGVKPWRCSARVVHCGATDLTGAL